MQQPIHILRNSAMMIVGAWLMAGHASARTNRPNVVVILADDQRADYLGCAGHLVVKTPNIDRLAAKGIRFENAFATTAACTPNRTSILTGQYERKHGVTFGSESSLSLEAFAETYPMVLRKAGYYVGYVGKNHSPIGLSPQGSGYSSGVMEKQFDYWYGNHKHSMFYPKGKHPIYTNSTAETQVEIFQEGALNFLQNNPSFSGASDFLKTKPDNQPFCLLVNFNVPHGAGTGSMEQRPTDPELYRSTYRDKINAMPRPETYVAKKSIRDPKIPKQVYNGKYLKGYNYVQTPKALRERQVLTCQTVTGIDQLTGAVIAELQHQGLLDNTIILYTSDHGLQHGEHGLGGKVLLYDESLRVPLIVYDPRLPDSQCGKTKQELALSIDIAPTLLELAGVPVPAEMQGKSLAPLMNDTSVSWRKDFFCENMFMGQNYPRIEGVRGTDFKYVRYFDKAKDQHHILSLTASIEGEQPVYEELYDLRNDALETKNLAPSSTHRKVLEHYRERCRELVVEAKGGPGYPKTHIENDPR
ncbi:Arylsulfatase [Pontiella desulfatans]|uniref:Arylsulfatase n=1 Tax=Pontiella desulfatans TaxID=2750659 RepID=A0A6C2TYV6_PONDE|nr:sulfatase-like hydrolase/transferase [Pontiella desulfatans]SPS73667.1 sulfatase S1_25 [Kiritimatiellales bacterium]VGO12376.1 Arylsulfatase [Pontiella desulfatans]